MGSTALIMFIACGGDDDGGSSNNGSGGSTSKAGSSSTAGSAGTSTSAGGTTSTGGTSSAGSSAGGTGGSASGFACANTAVSAASVTDFSDIGETGTWGTGDVSGGTFLYPEGDLTADYSGSSFKVSGEVGDYAGFGIWFAGCLDASSYDSISFDVTGDVGAAATLTIGLQINSDQPIDTTNMKGSCAFTSEATKYSECVIPVATVDVPAGGGTVTVPFSEFAGGKPVATSDGSELLGIQWSFAWAAGDTAYNVDVTIDNVTFGGPGSGSGGGGNEGGSPGMGGAGGAG